MDTIVVVLPGEEGLVLHVLLTLGMQVAAVETVLTSELLEADVTAGLSICTGIRI